MSARLAACLFVLALSACSSGPPTPAWQMSARSSLDASAIAWLEGRDAVDSAEFTRARAAVARTGQLDLIARAELHRCALRVATLVFEPCAGFDALATDATPAEQAYARYLEGRASAADVALLPQAQRAAATASRTSETCRSICRRISRTTFRPSRAFRARSANCWPPGPDTC